MEKSVVVIGLGYIGLPTAVLLADSGHAVFGVDVDHERVADVNRRELPFIEPSVESALARVVAQGRLTATTEMPRGSCYVVAVPTPFTPSYEADLSYVEAAAKALAPRLVGGELVILESTSPVGTTEHMVEVIREARPDLVSSGDLAVDVAYCPERVLPGQIMEELVGNDRIVGGMTPRAAERAKTLYESFCRGNLWLTDVRTAEMVKLAENAFRDVNIAFANELSIICAQLGIDVWNLIELANKHPRVQILNPGPGVGGHCIAVDPWFIVASAPGSAALISQARRINDDKPAWVIDQVRQVSGETSTIACLGLAFKANIDDLRGSPAVAIVEQLARELPRARLLAVEPHIEHLPPGLSELDNVELADLDEALSRCDLAVLLVDHSAFDRGSPPARLQGKPYVDTRGAWREAHV